MTIKALAMFEMAWRLYRTHARNLISTAALLLLPFAVVSAIGRRVTAGFMNALPFAERAELAGDIALFVFEVFIDAITAGAILLAVKAAREGRHAGCDEAWRGALDRAGALVWTNIVLLPSFLGWMLLFALPTGLLVGFGGRLFGCSENTTISLTVLPGIVFAAGRYALVTAVNVFERRTGGEAIDRAIELLHRHGRLALLTVGLIVGAEMLVSVPIERWAPEGWSHPLRTATSVLLDPLWAAMVVLLYEQVTRAPQAEHDAGPVGRSDETEA
jgi:hypothetical protein